MIRLSCTVVASCCAQPNRILILKYTAAEYAEAKDDTDAEGDAEGDEVKIVEVEVDEGAKCFRGRGVYHLDETSIYVYIDTIARNS